MARDMKYLTLRGNVYWLDCRIPESCGLNIKNGRLRVSLKTTDYEVAAAIRDRYIRPLFAISAADEALTELVRLSTIVSQRQANQVAALTERLNLDQPQLESAQ